MPVLTPITHVLAALVAALHALFESIVASAGMDPTSDPVWLLTIALLVVVVRTALLPLVVHGARSAQAAARARPELRALEQRRRQLLRRARSGRRADLESLRDLDRERRRIAGAHGVSRWGWLPVLLQLPIWLALYQLLAHAASGVAVGALDSHLVASLGVATVVGVPLAQRGLGGGAAHLAVLVGLAVAAAGLAYSTQRWLAPPPPAADLPETLVRVQQLAPAVSAAALLAAAVVVPVAVVVYWLCNNLWSAGQAAALRRWFPLPMTA